MRFACPSCNKRFDIGVPPGVTIPCPACGATLKPAEEGEEEPAEVEEKPAAGGNLLDEILSEWGDEGGSAAEEPTMPAREAPGEEAPPAAVATPEEPAAPEEEALEGAAAMQEDSSGWADLARAAEEAAAPPEEAPAPPPALAERQPPQRTLATRPLVEAVNAMEAEDALTPRGFPVGTPASARPGGLPRTLFAMVAVGCVGLAAAALLLYNKLSQARAERENFGKIAEQSKADKEKAEKERDDADKLLQDQKLKLAEDRLVLQQKLGEAEAAKRQAKEEASRAKAAAEKKAEEAVAERDKARAERDEARELTTSAEKSLSAAAEVSRALELMNNPGRLVEAEKLVTKAIDSGYDGPEAYLWRGWARMKRHKPEEAVDDFVTAEEVSRSGLPQALLYAGDVSRTMLGDEKKAAEYYRRAAGGKGHYSLVADARHAEALGELDKALKLAQKAVKEARTLWEARLALAEIDAKKILNGPVSGYTEENLKRVVDEFGRATKLNPLLAHAFAAKADFLFDVYLVTKDKFLLLRADRDAERASDIEPDLHYARFVRARTLIALGRPEDALTYLETVLRKEPWRSRAWVDKGTALLALSKSFEAEESFKEALRLNRNSILAHLGLARVCFKLGKYDEGLRALQDVVTQREDWPEAHLLIAGYYLHAPGKMNLGKAKTAALAAYNMTNGRNVRAIVMLVEILKLRREYEEAAKYVRMGLESFPRDKDLIKLRTTLGQVLRR